MKRASSESSPTTVSSLKRPRLNLVLDEDNDDESHPCLCRFFPEGELHSKEAQRWFRAVDGCYAVDCSTLHLNNLRKMKTILRDCPVEGQADWTRSLKVGCTLAKGTYGHVKKVVTEPDQDQSLCDWPERLVKKSLVIKSFPNDETICPCLMTEEDVAPASCSPEKHPLQNLNFSALHELAVHRCLGPQPGILEMFPLMGSNHKLALLAEWYPLTLTSYVARTLFCRDDVIRLVSQVWSSLGRIHAKGWIHFDLKPDNILVHPNPPSHKDMFVITDFGSSLPRLPKMGRLVTTEMCTPLFRAPEIFMHGRVTNAADIFSVGLCFFESILNQNRMVRCDEEQHCQGLGSGEKPLVSFEVTALTLLLCLLQALNPTHDHILDAQTVFKNIGPYTKRCPPLPPSVLYEVQHNNLQQIPIFCHDTNSYEWLDVVDWIKDPELLRLRRRAFEMVLTFRSKLTCLFTYGEVNQIQSWLASCLSINPTHRQQAVKPSFL